MRLIFASKHTEKTKWNNVAGNVWLFCAGVCVYVHVAVGACALGHTRRPEVYLSITSEESITVLFCFFCVVRFLRKGLSVAWNFPRGLEWVTSKLQGCTWLCLASARITVEWYHITFLQGFLGLDSDSNVYNGKQLCWPSFLPNLKVVNFCLNFIKISFHMTETLCLPNFSICSINLTWICIIYIQIHQYPTPFLYVTFNLVIKLLNNLIPRKTHMPSDKNNAVFSFFSRF